jgi:hypothetical protein
VGPGFHLLGAYWTGSAEYVDVIDTTTGVGTYVGTLGSLATWTFSVLTVNAEGTTVYAFGQTAGGADMLYTLDLQTGLSNEVATPEYEGMAGVTADGKAIGVRWNGSSEEVDLVDPHDGSSTYAGKVGDLMWWSQQSTYDPEGHVVYVLGNDASDSVDYLYALDLDTESVTKTPVSMPMMGYYQFGGYFPVKQSIRGAAALGATVGIPLFDLPVSTGDISFLTTLGSPGISIADAGVTVLDAATGRTFAALQTESSEAMTLYVEDDSGTTSLSLARTYSCFARQ